jgi:hypothetical protein
MKTLLEPREKKFPRYEILEKNSTTTHYYYYYYLKATIWQNLSNFTCWSFACLIRRMLQKKCLGFKGYKEQHMCERGRERSFWEKKGFSV